MNSSSSAVTQNNRTYECPVCEKEYSNKVVFGNHINRAHNGSIVQHDDNWPPPSLLGTVIPVDKPLGLSTSAPANLNPAFVSCAVIDERSGDKSPPQANDADYDCSSLDIAIFADGKQYLHATNDFHEEDNAEQGRPWSGNSERGEVACGVYNYYASFRDASEKLYPSVPPSFRSLKDLDPAVKAVLEYCTAAHLTLSESRCLFNLLAFLESSYPNAQRKLSIQFDNADRFSTYLDKAKKHIVALEGWRTSVIHSDHGINKTGVFRPVFDLLI
ncbi:unnamed protein product [Chondrus crispus]|uniref:C2H2-type domain-containing protein n=1 Tax=Chondrus crispus TaxID=2769 RepID=R7QMI2_CHOCR|nr:unnamed protein product [Chondrus crispus]CDF39309.1 unnamed protein product [Chondrus crispus]|eukprot:XP_005719220.1 unnamed protein product [Chondrus crispus]